MHECLLRCAPVPASAYVFAASEARPGLDPRQGGGAARYL